MPCGPSYFQFRISLILVSAWAAAAAPMEKAAASASAFSPRETWCPIIRFFLLSLGPIPGSGLGVAKLTGCWIKLALSSDLICC